jgi:retron-type reverse transcriptase
VFFVCRHWSKYAKYTHVTADDDSAKIYIRVIFSFYFFQKQLCRSMTPPTFFNSLVTDSLIVQMLQKSVKKLRKNDFHSILEKKLQHARQAIPLRELLPMIGPHTDFAIFEAFR